MRIRPEEMFLYDSPYRYTKSYSVYQVTYQCVGQCKELALKEFRSDYARTKRLIQKKGLPVTLVMGLSHHKGNSKKIIESASVKGGRRKRVIGEETLYHIHQYLALPKEKKGLSVLTKSIADKKRKRFEKVGIKRRKPFYKKNTCNENSLYCCLPYEYVESQSDYMLTFGNVEPFKR